MKKIILIFAAIMGMYNIAQAQVAVNTDGSAAVASAMLDIGSTEKGLLVPRMTSIQRTEITNPANGLLVFDTDTDSFFYYDEAQTGWMRVGAKVAGAGIINELGDAISDGTSVFMGAMSGTNDDGGNYNTSVGIWSLNENTSGMHNISFGNSALKLNNTGWGNTAIGSSALSENTTGTVNTALGYYALKSIAAGSGNIAIGGWALWRQTSGTGNVAIGYASSSNNTTGYGNTTIGHDVDNNNQTGWENTIIGYQAGKGESVHNKSGNIFLGYKAGYYEMGDNKLYIESSDSPTPLIGGDFGTDEIYFNGKVGISTSSPSEALEINGSLKITDGNQGNGKVFISDAGGKGSWTDPAVLNDNDWVETTVSLLRIARGDTLVAITNSGNMGIGTTSPGAKLDVAGHIWQTGTGNSIFLGEQAGLNDDLSDNSNVFIGHGAGKSNTTGEANVAVSRSALFANTTGNTNMALGYRSLYSNTTGSYNHAIGYEALASNTTAESNIAIGFKSMHANTTGFSNIAIGSGALFSNTTRDFSVAIGDSALYNNGMGATEFYHATHNTAIGSKTLFSNTTGCDNTAIGYQSLYSNITGYNNTAIGSGALSDNMGGYHNTANGAGSLSNNTTGCFNTASGLFSLSDNMGGYSNTASGAYSLEQNTTGNNNTAFGYSAGHNIFSGSNNTAFGHRAFVASGIADNQLSICNFIYGTGLDGYDNVISDGKIGLGTKSPNEILEVADKDNGHGRMIISDAGGNDRYVLLFESPSSSDAVARIESYKYGAGAGGKTLEINTVGDAKTIFGGDVVPEAHKNEDLGSATKAWDDFYCDDVHNMGAAAFTDRTVTDELIDYPPRPKNSGDFDEFTDKGLKELDPNSIPPDLCGGYDILTDEMTTYNYKANYEQQLIINQLLKEIELLKKEMEKLKNKTER